MGFVRQSHCLARENIREIPSFLLAGVSALPVGQPSEEGAALSTGFSAWGAVSTHKKWVSESFVLQVLQQVLCTAGQARTVRLQEENWPLQCGQQL